MKHACTDYALEKSCPFCDSKCFYYGLNNVNLEKVKARGQKGVGLRIVRQSFSGIEKDQSKDNPHHTHKCHKYVTKISKVR